MMSEAVLDIKKCKTQALNYAAVEFDRLKMEETEVGTVQVKRNACPKVLTNAQKKVDLPDNEPLCKEVIHSRIRDGRKLLVTHYPGPIFPMVAVKALLLDAIVQFATMR